MLVPLAAAVVGTAVDRYLAADLDPMGLVADATRLARRSACEAGLCVGEAFSWWVALWACCTS
jgi:hypothetical protein